MPRAPPPSMKPPSGWIELRAPSTCVPELGSRVQFQFKSYKLTDERMITNSGIIRNHVIKKIAGVMRRVVYVP